MALRIMRPRLVFLTLSLLATVCAEAPAVHVFHIGNSLTHGLQVKQLEEWAAARESRYVVGRHIHQGASLDDIWQWRAESQFPVLPYGNYFDALPANRWDAVTLEPFFDDLPVATARVADFTALATPPQTPPPTPPKPTPTTPTPLRPKPAQPAPPSSTRHTPPPKPTQPTPTRPMPPSPTTPPQVYIYQAWPQYQWGDYATMWDKPYLGGENLVFTRDYYRQLMANVSPAAKIIPTGEVFYELDARIKRGELAGIDTITDLYRIDVCTCHLNDLGNFVLTATVYATIFQESPVGLSHPDFITEELATTIQETSWQVVAGHYRSGVAATGDFDGDGLITLNDYTRWKRNFQLGISDTAGYTAWRNASGSPVSATNVRLVPEPSTWIALLIASLACSRRKR